MTINQFIIDYQVPEQENLRHIGVGAKDRTDEEQDENQEEKNEEHQEQEEDQATGRRESESKDATGEDHPKETRREAH